MNLQIAGWLVEPTACRMSRDGVVVHLRPQLMDLLACLARRPGEVWQRDELLDEVWRDKHCAGGLARCVAELRDAFGDDAHRPRVIETITKRGYRLIARVEPVPEDPSPAPLPGPLPDNALASAPAAATPPCTPPGPRLHLSTPSLRGIGALVALALAGVVAMVWWLAAGTDAPADAIAGRGRVLLAFANETGDATLGHALELALALQIESDPTLVVLSDERVKTLLHRAGRRIDAASAPVTPETAASVCAEAGASAVLNGLVKQVADRFVLTLEASSCAAGAPIARQEADVVGAEQVLTELRRMATHVRRRLVASLGTVPGHAAREPGQVPPTPAGRSLGGV